jgi:leucyl aminopeptidase (aminopeptidase T)
MNHWPLDDRVLRGVETLLDDFVRVENTDSVAVVYTPDSREPAAWIAIALEERGFAPKIVAMHPIVDPLFGERLTAALPAVDDVAGHLVVIALERDTMSHFEVFQSVVNTYGRERCKVFRAIGASPELFAKAFNRSPQELSALNATLLNRLQPASTVRVTSPGGTDVRVEFDSEKYQWISNRGEWRPGGYTMLPAGEIATYPVNVHGVLVADGAFNANIVTSLDARLAENPVRVEIKNGKAVGLSCAYRALQELLQLCLNSRYGSNVGEFGIGTNTGIGDFVAANTHVNERHCGLHLGFGQHNQSLLRVPYVADVHLDLITNGARLWVDDDPEPIDLSHVVPSGAPHPADVLDEDITSDCCGIGVGRLRSLACPANN